MVRMSNPQKAKQAEAYLGRENHHKKNAETRHYRGAELKRLGVQKNTPIVPLKREEKRTW